MKARFYLLAAVLLSLVSCNEPAGVEEFSLKADPGSMTFAATGAVSQQIRVNSENVVWTASIEEECDWIELSVNDDLITVTVSDNETYEARSNRIAISSDIESVETVYVSVIQEGMDRPEAISLKSEGVVTYYAADFLYPTNSNGEWLFHLFTEDSDVNINWQNFGKDGYWTAEIVSGRKISLYMYCDLSEDYFNPQMVSGEYLPCASNDEIAEMTFSLSQENPNGLPWPSGSFVADYSGGNAEYYYIVDGKVDLETDGENYEMEIYLVLDDGSELYYSYSGTLNLSLLGNPPYYSDLDDDLVMDTDDFSDVSVSGSSVDSSSEYAQWMVRLMSDGINVDQFGKISGEGVFCNLIMFSSYEDGLDNIPEGTYVLDKDLDQFNPYEFSALPGVYDPVLGNSGCYFGIYSSEGNDFVPLDEGSIKVTDIGGGIYRFEISGKDDNNHNITVVYEGAVTIR